MTAGFEIHDPKLNPAMEILRKILSSDSEGFNYVDIQSFTTIDVVGILLTPEEVRLCKQLKGEQ